MCKNESADLEGFATSPASHAIIILKLVLLGGARMQFLGILRVGRYLAIEDRYLALEDRYLAIEDKYLAIEDKYVTI